MNDELLRAQQETNDKLNALIQAQADANRIAEKRLTEDRKRNKLLAQLVLNSPGVDPTNVQLTQKVYDILDQ